MAKLDPDNAKSAKDVMDDRAAAGLKRKWEGDGVNDYEVPTEKQREGLKLHDREEKRSKTDKKRSKSKRAADDKAQGPSLDDSKMRKGEEKGAKRETKQAKQLKAQQKVIRKKVQKEAALSNEPNHGTNKEVDQAEDEGGNPEMIDGVDSVENSMMIADGRHSTASASSEIISPIQSPQLHSGSSSMSSIQTQSIPTQSTMTKSAAFKLAPEPSTASDASTLTPRQRLEARINALRAERKADGPDGRPPRNRQELLESRRRRDEERRAHKKELRRKAKQEETQRQEEEIAKRFSPGGSGSLIASPRSPMEPGNNFSFGRVAFGDGTQADSSLSSWQEQRKKKGVSDVNTALKAAQNKAARLSGLDESKRADIEEKDVWLKAKKKAHGERVKDDTSLLKKALKGQEGVKAKSEKQWQGRIEGVAKGQEVRQRKRQRNIEKRREEKGGGGKKSDSHKSGGSGKKAKVKRRGFEGSFKTKLSGRKK